MKKLAWVELKRNNYLRLSEIVNPETLETDEKDCSDVTAFDVVYIERVSSLDDDKREQLYKLLGKETTDEHFSKNVFTNEYYFVGKIVDYSEVEDRIIPEYREEYKDKKFVATYDEDGTICDFLPYSEEMHPVDDVDTLRHLYYKKTGYILPTFRKKAHEYTKTNNPKKI